MTLRKSLDALDDTDTLTVTEIRKLKQLAEFYTVGHVLTGAIVTLAALGAAVTGLWHLFAGTGAK